MKIEWQKLRAFNGDVKYAFEELVCQLARAEELSGNKEFYRLGAPDAGVEAYWVLENGQEYGWQAKFFDSVGDKQLAQIENSFKTAFSKHPNLVRYYVCVPIDRSDPRIKDQKWSMDKWNEKTGQWKEFAQERGRQIDFIYWGSSEIFDRLAKKDNQGKYAFWFYAEEFTNEWFSKRLAESVSNLGIRYTPEINVSLPIVKIFDGLSRDGKLKDICTGFVDDLLRKSTAIVKSITHPTLVVEADAVTRLTGNFKTSFAQINFNRISIDIWDNLENILDGIKDQVSEIKKKLYDIKELNKAQASQKTEGKHSVQDPSYEIRKVEEFEACIDNFKVFIESPTAKLSYNPQLVITGNAGVGKSHLLADIALERKSRNLPTIMLLGQQFNNDEPWSQISKRLQTTYTGDKLLGALDSLGEAIQSRVLIFIDAINEGHGRHLWPDNLPALLESIARYSNLGLVLSVRSSYKELLIPETLVKSKRLVVVTHNWFSNHEYDAIKIFSITTK